MAHTPRTPLLSPDRRRRGIYILPNLFTTAALFAGFYAIVQAMNQRFEYAAVAIFVAMVLDGLDGRVARLTRTQSEFGAEYDSLSDMVSFGAAPALVIYEWALRGLGKVGWIAAFIYCAGAALRPARFNTNIDVVDKRYFQGLPSPAAAALIAGLVWVGIDNGFHGPDLRWFACFLTIFAGLTMVSNVLYYSGRKSTFAAACRSLRCWRSCSPLRWCRSTPRWCSSCSFFATPRRAMSWPRCMAARAFGAQRARTRRARRQDCLSTTTRLYFDA